MKMKTAIEKLNRIAREGTMQEVMELVFAIRHATTSELIRQHIYSIMKGESKIRLQTYVLIDMLEERMDEADINAIAGM